MAAVESDRHRPVTIGAEDVGAPTRQSLKRRCRGMTVRVPGTHRNHRDARSNRIEEWVGRGCAAPVVSDFEQVHAWQAPGEEDRIDALFDIPRQQESLSPERSEQHDRDVVDPRSRVWRCSRHTARVGPQHLEVDVVELEGVARREAPGGDVSRRKGYGPGAVARAGTGHSRFGDTADPVTLEQCRQPRDMVLVRV